MQRRQRLTTSISTTTTTLFFQTQIAATLIFFSTTLLVLNHAAEGSINRSSFPGGFIFGAASSAYQYEGAANMDGRQPSIWDTFVRENPEKISDHSTGNVAEEFYFLFKGDIVRMKQIGLDSFRFSISWPRVLPLGKISRGVNREGIDFYNFLIDELLANGIQPLITLFHWDLPQALEDEYGGFLSPKIVDDFRDYAELCFKEFGDRVKLWVTVNEPNLFSEVGYADGAYAPGRCSDYIGNCSQGNSATEPYIVTHHLLLSHATAKQLYHQKYQASQKGKIGVTVSCRWFVPKFDTLASREAATRAHDFECGWIIHPLIYGDYPQTMQVLVGSRLPIFTEGQSKMVKGSIDFLGVNYYTARYAANDSSSSTTLAPNNYYDLSYTTDSRVNLTTETNGIPIGQPTAVSWLYIYPRGIQDLLLYIKTRYKMSPPIIITENGMGDPQNESFPDEALNDSLRIKYHRLHLSNLSQAIKKGVDVRGYYIWTFLDDFEWAAGYTQRFGINYINYNDGGLQRHFKKSALWFRNFLRPRSPRQLARPPAWGDI